MVKEFLMKKLLISLGVFACVTVNAQTASDSVVMTVAGKQVPLSEFIFIAEKNGEVDLSNTKSVKNYVELFKNFKLKVAEAESLGIDQTSSFKSELDGYRAQLIDSYMSAKRLLHFACSSRLRVAALPVKKQAGKIRRFPGLKI